MSQVEARSAIKDFAQLGSMWGITPEPRTYSPDRLLDFAALPLEKKIEQIEDGFKTRDPLLKVYKAMTTYEVLHLDSRTQRAKDIRVVTIAPLTPDGQIDYQPFREYGSFVISEAIKHPFGYFQGKVMVDSDRSQIMRGSERGQEFSHDRLLLTEWMPEAPYDRYFNLALSIKQVDREIGKAKKTEGEVVRSTPHTTKSLYRYSTTELTYLNSLKHEFLVEYLEAADALQDQFPYLGKLAVLDPNDSSDGFHMRLYMTIPKDRNSSKRSSHPLLSPVPRADQTILFDTSINTSIIRQEKENTDRGSQDPADQLGWDLCRHLGI